ncbi:MAG: hypothetical protein J7L39_02690 [Candidatus Aenigmarchaeota archaeon]|nr:hypothetical protein [Candidatus Aenigmarchaeota archaeon]
MKGISAIIATLLILLITIGLAGLAYSYISGVFTARTAVVLSIDKSSFCNTTHVIAFVRNDGTSQSSTVTVRIYGPSGNLFGNCTIPSIQAGDVGSCAAAPPGGSSVTTGYYTITAITTGSSARGSVYCS